MSWPRRPSFCGRRARRSVRFSPASTPRGFLHDTRPLERDSRADRRACGPRVGDRHGDDRTATLVGSGAAAGGAHDPRRRAGRDRDDDRDGDDRSGDRRRRPGRVHLPGAGFCGHGADPRRCRAGRAPRPAGRRRTRMGGEKIVAGLIAAAGAHWLAGCGQARPLTVGSKNFTEQVILGEIVAQHVSLRLSQRVDRKLNLGGTLLAHPALVKGDLALYPEYTGTALTARLKLPLSSDPDAVFAKVKAEYLARFNVHWLDPLGFNNTFAMVIRGADARKYQIESLSDAARHANGWTLGVGYEFQRRRCGLAGLLKTYKLPLKRRPHPMDLGLLYKALEQKQVDMVAANATDGLLSVLDVKILKDDKRYFPPYQASLAVPADALAKHPPLKRTLEQLSGLFSDEIMRTLNYQVDGKHLPVSEVAITFLRASKLLA